MDQTITISKARSSLLELPKTLAHKKGEHAVAVTKRGKPILAIMSWDFYESIIETLEIMGDTELMKELREGIRQADTGQTIAWEKAKQDLDL